MVGEDTKWVARETNMRKKLEEKQRRRDRWLEEQRPLKSVAVMVDSSSSEENEKSFTFSSQKVKRSTSQRKIDIRERVASALDRTQISDRKAGQTLLPFAAYIGHNIEDLAINPSSIRRKEISNRTLLAAELKESFSPNVPLTLHWDSNLMPDLIGREKIERLAILVSREGVEKILSVPKVSSGDANSVASEVGSFLVEWNVKDIIKSLLTPRRPIQDPNLASV